MIQISPLPTMAKMKEYTEMLLNIYVRPHYRAGVLEVHVIFDNPGGLPESPKQLEQGRRDAAQTQELVNHQCLNFASSTNIPQHWRSTIACRKCKSNLTAYLGEEFISLSPNFMHNLEQEFITNIKGQAQNIENIISPSLTPGSQQTRHTGHNY